MTRICVSLVEGRKEDLRPLIERCADSGADMVEIRADALEGPQVGKEEIRLIKDLGMKSILTVRPAWEGGLFKEPEGKRLELLRRIILLEPDMIDLELKIDGPVLRELIDEARRNGVETIISSHHPETTPDASIIKDLIGSAGEIGGDTVKMVFHCDTFKEAVEILTASTDCRKMGIRHSVMGTGQFGHITRMLAPLTGCEIVYCGLDGPNIKGQLSIEELKNGWEDIGIGDGHR